MPVRCTSGVMSKFHKIWTNWEKDDHVNWPITHTQWSCLTSEWSENIVAVTQVISGSKIMGLHVKFLQISWNLDTPPELYCLKSKWNGKTIQDVC